MQSEWTQVDSHVRLLEQTGHVTRTFRRLDPSRQKAIIDAVLEEAVELGPASINIKRVAARAGVSVGSLYTYFPNRQGLLDFTIQLTTLMTAGAFEQTVAYLEAVPLRDALRQYIEYGIEWSRSQGAWLSFFGRAAYQGDPQMAERVVRPIAAAMREVITRLLRAAQSRGELRPDLDLEAAARLVHSLLIAVGDSQLLPYLNDYFQVTSDEMSLDRMLTAMIELIMNGIAPHPVD